MTQLKTHINAHHSWCFYKENNMQLGNYTNNALLHVSERAGLQSNNNKWSPHSNFTQ